jgi:hypothetical protein
VDWNGPNRTYAGAEYTPLGRIIGMAAYGIDIEGSIDGREARRLIRSLNADDWFVSGDRKQRWRQLSSLPIS